MCYTLHTSEKTSVCLVINAGSLLGLLQAPGPEGDAFPYEESNDVDADVGEVSGLGQTSIHRGNHSCVVLVSQVVNHGHQCLFCVLPSSISAGPCSGMANALWLIDRGTA